MRSSCPSVRLPLTDPLDDTPGFAPRFACADARPHNDALPPRRGEHRTSRRAHQGAAGRTRDAECAIAPAPRHCLDRPGADGRAVDPATPTPPGLATVDRSRAG